MLLEPVYPGKLVTPKVKFEEVVVAAESPAVGAVALRSTTIPY